MNTPLEVTDFSGGMTDLFLAGPINQGEKFDNLLIDHNKKPYTRAGSRLRDTTNYQIPSGNKRISYLFDHRDQIIEQSEQNLYYLTTAYQTLTGPTGNPAFDTASESTHMSQAFWNNHSLIVGDSFTKPVKVFRNTSSTGTLKLLTAGLPAITAPTVTAGAAGANNYIYAFLYYNTYDVEGVTFEDFSATVEVQLLLAADPSVSNVSITNIPVIANGLTTNYDTTAIKVKIYRTEANLTTLKYVGQVANGVTVYTDSSSDATITNNVVIYTTGDVVDNDPPPPAKFVHVTNNIALYGYVQESGISRPTRLRQSLPDDIDSCPESFFDDLPEEIMGINSIQNTFIVFCKQSIYRVEGFFDEQGRGGLSHFKITDTYGAVSNDAIVSIENGIIFASQAGWCHTDGFKVRKISHHLDDTYADLIQTAAQARNMWAAHNKNDERVWFAAQKNLSSLDNDICYILDLHWGLSDFSTFTSASNGDSWRPTCLLFKDTNMYRAHNKGFVLEHDDSYLTDPLIDLTKLGSNWATKTIIHDYKSCSLNFGTSFVRKFVPKILITLDNLTNIALGIISNNDNGKKIASLVELRSYAEFIWGDPELIWGTSSYVWNKTGLIEEKRRFPAKGLRCNYKQIELTNSFTIIGNSDLYGQGVLDPVAKTLTFVNTNSKWPTEVVGYFLTFVNDLYVQTFEVTTRNSDTVVTLLDPLSLLPAANTYKWEMKGYRKNEKLHLLSYVIHHKMLSDSQKPFNNPSDFGGNA